MDNVNISKNTTIAVAESCTGGLLSSTFVSKSGSSLWYKGGIIAYNIDAKVKLLGVTRDHAEKVNCVSNIVAIEMAKGTAHLFNTNIGISVTGYADGNNQHAYVALYNKEKNYEIDILILPSGVMTRNEFRLYIVQQIIDKLIELTIFDKNPN